MWVAGGTHFCSWWRYNGNLKKCAQARRGPPKDQPGTGRCPHPVPHTHVQFLLRLRGETRDWLSPDHADGTKSWTSRCQRGFCGALGEAACDSQDIWIFTAVLGT